MARREVSKSFWVKLILAPIAMFAFAFALVPLYDVLCDLTGFNGRSTNASYQNTAQAYEIDESREVAVDFSAVVAPGFPVKFYPKVNQMKVIPGKMYTTYYLAENRSNDVIVGQAVPSVAPIQAATHFKKLQCFCFDRQEFKPKQLVEMPVRFVVEPQMDGSVKNVSLSYNFFKIEDQSES